MSGINWGLQGEGFNALEVLQSFGQAQQQRQRQDTMARQQQVGGMAAQGDLQGAQRAALQGGDFDAAGQISKLDAQQRAQAATEARTLAAAATRLRTLPPEQRAQALQSFAPVLRASGFDEQEITGADLSDGGLDNYINVGKAFLDNTDAQDEPSIIRTLQAVGIDPRSPEGRDIVTRSLTPSKFVTDSLGRVTMVQGAPSMGSSAPNGGGDPPPDAVAALRGGQGTPEQFDEIFGAGAAARVMGGAASQAPAPFPIR